MKEVRQELKIQHPGKVLGKVHLIKLKIIRLMAQLFQVHKCQTMISNQNPH
jgi:hypothetical protein